VAPRTLGRRKVLGATAIGAAGLGAASLVGCGGGNSTGSTSPTTAAGAASTSTVKHGSINHGTGGVATTLSPNSSALWSSEFYALYDPLVRLEADGSLSPALATAWKQEAPDRWVFTLRDNVKWSDGQPFTADDVKFTIDYISDPANKSAQLSRGGDVKSVEILDPKTVAFNMNGNNSVFMRRQALILIQPKHYLGNPSYGDAAQATKPVGTGPYTIDSYTQGSQINLKVNPNSWRQTQGVDAVHMRIIQEPTTLIAALQTGEVDLIDGVPINQVTQIGQFPHMKVVSAPSSAYNGFDLEYFDPPYNDKRVRLAMQYAVDSASILKTIYFGTTKVMQGQMLTSPTFGFNPNLQAYPYSPDKAKALLQQAGLPNGFQTKIEYRTDQYPSQQVAEAVASYFKAVGITATLVPIDISVWRDGLYGRRKRSPLMWNTWSSSLALEASIALQWMLSSNAGKYYNRPDFDALYKQAFAETDDEKRKGIYAQATAIMNDDPPGMWIVEGPVLAAYDTSKIADLKLLGAPPIYYDTMRLA